MRLRRIYHLDDALEIPEDILNSLKWQITQIEDQYPQLKTEGSQSSTVVGGVRAGFAKVTHTVRQWSLNDIFTEEDLIDFDKRIKKDTQGLPVEYFVDEKIDGLKIILTYHKGVLTTAATRGDGLVGEAVTENIKTIASIPHTLTEPLSVVVEGEAFITVAEFNKIIKTQTTNERKQFANPRNLVAGSIRQQDPEVVKKQGTQLFCLRHFWFDTRPHRDPCRQTCSAGAARVAG